jgi:ferredoxin
MACNRPSEVCIRLDEGARLTLEYGHGRRLTKEECKEIVVNANRAGLMQTGLRDWEGRDLFGFCNCCGCCCFPFRAGIRLGIEKQWPRSHHVATRDLEACVHCGLCANRCYFDAFYQEGSTVEVDGTVRQAIQFDPEKCWGCGICATACPEGAIIMTPLRESEREEPEA